jgi:hypothetical protein
MNVGDKVTVPFGKGTKEGVVIRMCEKNIWLKVDFPRHPGKLICRKRNQIEGQAGKKRGRRARKAQST